MKRNEFEPEAAMKSASDEMDRVCITVDGSDGSGGGHQLRTNDGQTSPTPAGAPSHRRGLAAALLGGAAAIALLPERAKADLNFGDVQRAVQAALRSVVRPLLQAIQSILGEIFDFLREVLAFIGLSLPQIFFDVINAVLDALWLESPANVMREDTLEEALERSYPRDAPSTPEGTLDVIWRRAGDIRERITIAQTVHNAASARMGEMTMADDAVATAALASGSVGAAIEALVVLQQSADARLSLISGQLTALAALQIDHVARYGSELEHAVQRHGTFMVDRDRQPAPVDRLPGIPGGLE
jgi:hypothetical protein